MLRVHVQPVYVNEWRPDEDPLLGEGPWHTFYCAGVGRKP